jgi:hypothetical protein
VALEYYKMWFLFAKLFSMRYLNTLWKSTETHLFLRHKTNFFLLSFIRFKAAYKICLIINFWRLFMSRRAFQFRHLVRKKVSPYKEEHFVELEILHLFTWKG